MEKGDFFYEEIILSLEAGKKVIVITQKYVIELFLIYYSKFFISQNSNIVNWYSRFLYIKTDDVRVHCILNIPTKS